MNNIVQFHPVEQMVCLDDLTVDQQQAAEAGNLAEWICAHPARGLVELVAESIATASDADMEDFKLCFAYKNKQLIGAIVLRMAKLVLEVHHEEMAGARRAINAHFDSSDYTGDAA